MDNSSGAITSAGKQATLIEMTINPQYSIDVSSLGGITANSISMVGNNIGFGVRNGAPLSPIARCSSPATVTC